jgi:hypothetical protein
MKKILMITGLFVFVAFTQQSNAQGKSGVNKNAKSTTVHSNENSNRQDVIVNHKTTTSKSHTGTQTHKKAKKAKVRHDNGLHKGWYKGKHNGWYKNGKRVG